MAYPKDVDQGSILRVTITDPATGISGGASSTAAPDYTRIQDGTGTGLASVSGWGNTDGIGGTNAALLSAGFGTGFNGTTWDRIRSNTEATLLASAARTTTQTSADISVYNLKYLSVVLDMTVVGTGSVTVTINRKDVASGKYVLLLSGAAVTTNVTNTYDVGPTLVAAVNAVATKSLGTIIQIVVTANNANAATYSVGYALTP